ncbi:MAG: YfhO family protein [Blautia wexlerae]
MINWRVVSQPVKGIEKKTAKLGQETLENVVMGTNEITGNITCFRKRKPLVLVCSVQSGFTAYVDGKETKLQKANTMFMALELEPGEHDIRLTYCTPYLKPGIVLSVIWD